MSPALSRDPPPSPSSRDRAAARSRGQVHHGIGVGRQRGFFTALQMESSPNTPNSASVAPGFRIATCSGHGFRLTLTPPLWHRDLDNRARHRPSTPHSENAPCFPPGYAIRATTAGACPPGGMLAAISSRARLKQEENPGSGLPKQLSPPFRRADA